jgi:hypothetical protein
MKTFLNCTLIFLALLITIKKLIGELLSECENESKKYLSNNKRSDEENLTFSFMVNFKEFNDLILKCNQTYNITKYVSMWPKKPLILDKNIVLKKIFNQSRIDSIEIFEIGNIKGIDLNSRPFILARNRFKQVTFLHIFHSNLDTYSNSVLINSDECSLEKYNRTIHFIKFMYGIRFHQSRYPQKWCPYFFKDFDAVNLVLKEIKNSFLSKNRLNFYQLNTTFVFLKKLYALQLIMTYETLDNKNLSPSLFKNMEYFGVTGVLNGIQSDLFIDFQNLKIIDLAISNLKELFHQGNQWMDSLNINKSKKSKKHAKNSLILKFIYLKQSVSFDSIYEFPNEDLCLFKEFPHERLVYPLIVPGKQLECTCTLLWLQSNITKYIDEIKLTKDYNLNYQEEYVESSFKNVFLYCNESFNVSHCNFNQTFKLCPSHHKDNREFAHKIVFQNDIDILYMIKFLNFILLVILQPIFCLIGIVHNTLTILVIKNKNKKKEFQEPMYKHIIINAVFNIIYCLIISFKLINTCIFYSPSVFCSSVYQEEWAQNLKIVLVQFLGTSAKFCSNFSYIIFSISRLWLITRRKVNNANDKNKKLYTLIYIFVLVLTSFIFSLFKLFQYRINNYFYTNTSNKEFPFEIRDEIYCNDENNRFQCKLFYIFKIANRSLNDVLFVILNLIIDLVLLVKYRKHMKRKLKQINDVAQHKLIEKNTKYINRMILFNSLIYVLSHLPEFTMTLLLKVYSKKISNFCNDKLSCDLLNEEAEFFSFISIVCQFYVFKIFDRNFKSSLNQMVSDFYSFFAYKKKEEIIYTNNTNVELVNLKNLIGNGRIE